MPDPSHWSNRLALLHSCSEGVAFASQHEDIFSVWKHCQRGDWLLWLTARLCLTEDDRRQVIGACVTIAQAAFVVLPPEEERLNDALTIAYAWSDGAVQKDKSSLRHALQLALSAKRDLDKIAPAMGAAAASVAATLCAIGDAERAWLPDDGSVRSPAVKWAEAATRPAAWHAASLSAAAHALFSPHSTAAQTKAQCLSVAADAFASSADIVRVAFEADEILEPLIHWQGGRREPNHRQEKEAHDCNPR
jgi:hypothetical protein